MQYRCTAGLTIDNAVIALLAQHKITSEHAILADVNVHSIRRQGDMTVSTNIDRFWQALNKRPTGRTKAISNIPSTSVSASKHPSPASADSADQHSDQLQQLQITRQVLPAGSQLTYEDLERVLQRDLQSLKAPAPARRCQALRNLKAIFCSPAPLLQLTTAVMLLGAMLQEVTLAAKPLAEAQILQEATEHLLAKPLLLCAADKSEACRDLAISLLLGLLQV